jgi:ferredoxin
MTFVVTDACIRCKFMDCVQVCPVEAFREGATMLVIDPNECIDCNLCLPECPADAILPDIESGATAWIELNKTYAGLWPVVSRKLNQTPDDAEAFNGVAGKFEAYFSAEPGKGD